MSRRLSGTADVHERAQVLQVPPAQRRPHACLATSRADVVLDYVVVAYVVMAYVVMAQRRPHACLATARAGASTLKRDLAALSSCGRCSYGPRRHGLHSYGLYEHGRYHHGVYSDGVGCFFRRRSL